MTYNIDPVLQRLIRQQIPAASAAGSFSPLPGIGCLSGKVTWGEEQWLARGSIRRSLPFINRQRECRILKKLTKTRLGPRVIGYAPPWLLLEWRTGESLTAADFSARLPELSQLMTQLHHQPPTGYRLSLLSLLQTYWQRCQQRTIRWQRALRRLQQQGEPAPLRLAPLHMDIHSGNVLDDGQQLRLIDWEYAADGDIALELAVMCRMNALSPAECDALIKHYAAQNCLPVGVLTRQIYRWQPWLRLLIASWTQWRSEQHNDARLQRDALAAWQCI